MKFALHSDDPRWQPRCCRVLIETLATGFRLNSFRVIITVFALTIPSMAFGQDAARYFRANCMTCHTIGGGRLTGPDLKDVTKRKDAEWLTTFIQNPKSVIDSGDAYAAKLLESSRGVVMPLAPGMSKQRAEDLIQLIEAESKLEKSQFEGVKFSVRPFTELDRLTGQDYFTGVEKLKNGGTACNSCHSMYNLSAFGGGRLGPDLTRVFERLKGRKALSAWLVAPPTETMQPIFMDHGLDVTEIHTLVAYFEDAASHSEADASITRIGFLLAGLAFATVLVFLFDFIWRSRFHSVRRPLVETIRRQIHQGPNNENDKSVSNATPVAAGSGSERGLERGEQ